MAQVAGRKSTEELHEAHRRAIRARSECLAALDLGIVTLLDVVEMATTSPVSPLRKLRLSDLLTGEKRLSDRDRRRVVRLYAKFAGAANTTKRGIKSGAVRVDGLVDRRRYGNGILALVDAMSIAINNPPSPRFPFDRMGADRPHHECR